MDEDRRNERENPSYYYKIKNESTKEMALQDTGVPKARRRNPDGERVNKIIEWEWEGVAFANNRMGTKKINLKGNKKNI